MKVLLVDDEQDFRETLAKRLARRGIEASTAGGAAEALAWLKQNAQVDDVVLDVKMPGMSGQQTLSEIKKIDPDIEVIILTGHASVDIAAEMITHGGSDYLLKPYPMDELLGIIHIAYDRRKAAKGL